MQTTNSNAAQTNPIIYSEEFGNATIGTGELVVKQLDKAGTQFALIGYTHAGIDNCPSQFARGTLEDCRKAYKAAKHQMQIWYPTRFN